MKKIKIFVNAYDSDLNDDQSKIGMFLNRINNTMMRTYERGKIEEEIYCEPIFFEDESALPDYNSFIDEAYAVFIIFASHTVRSTVEQLMYAHARFLQSRSTPRIHTYFKSFDKSSLCPNAKDAHDFIVKKEHYFGAYTAIETVILELMFTIADFSSNQAERPVVKDGMLYFCSTEIMSTAELDYIRNNKEIIRLNNRIADLTAELNRGIGYQVNINRELERLREDRDRCYSSCFKALEAKFKSVANASKYDSALQQAYIAAGNGDYASVISILDRGSLRRETDREIASQNVSHKEFYETTFNKYVQLLKALEAEARYDELKGAYEDAIYAIDKLYLFDIDKGCLDIWYDFISFLEEHSSTERALELAKQLEGLYSFKPRLADDYGMGRLYDLIAILYVYLNNPNEAEKYYVNAIGKFEKLAEIDPDRYSGDLANSYNSIGVFYSDRGKPDEAKNFHKKAIEIYEGLAQADPDGYSGDLANSYNSIGVFYAYRSKLNEAENFFKKAIEIRERLAEIDPDRYSGDLANSYNNIGGVYDSRSNPNEAESYYKKAIEIYESLAQADPDRYSGDLARSYNNIGGFYRDRGKPDEAESYYKKAIEIREKLAMADPDRYSGDLADSYNNMGIFYAFRGKSDEAENFYKKAIKIREKLAEIDPDRYNRALAFLYYLCGTLNIKEYYVMLKRAYALAKNALHDPMCRKIVEKLKDLFS